MSGIRGYNSAHVGDDSRYLGSFGHIPTASTMIRGGRVEDVQAISKNARTPLDGRHHPREQAYSLSPVVHCDAVMLSKLSLLRTG
jgi:hypothetical protein